MAKKSKYAALAAILLALLGFFVGQMIGAAQVAHYTIGGTNFYLEVEEPFVVTVTPPRGEFKLFPGEEVTITFKVRNKNNELDYSAVFVWWVDSSGMLFVDDLSATWTGVDGETKLEGHGEQKYPWVFVKRSTARGEPGPESVVTLTLKLEPTAPSGLYTLHVMVKRTEALVALTWSAEGLLYNNTVLPCIMDNAVKMGMPPSVKGRAICVVSEGGKAIAEATDLVVHLFDLRVAYVYYLMTRMSMSCQTAYNLEKGIDITGGVDCLEGTGLPELNCAEVLAYISANQTICEAAIVKALGKCP